MVCFLFHFRYPQEQRLVDIWIVLLQKGKIPPRINPAQTENLIKLF